MTSPRHRYQGSTSTHTASLQALKLSRTSHYCCQHQARAHADSNSDSGRQYHPPVTSALSLQCMPPVRRAMLQTRVAAISTSPHTFRTHSAVLSCCAACLLAHEGAIDPVCSMSSIAAAWLLCLHATWCCCHGPWVRTCPKLTSESTFLQSCLHLCMPSGPGIAAAACLEVPTATSFLQHRLLLLLQPQLRAEAAAGTSCSCCCCCQPVRFSLQVVQHSCILCCKHTGFARGRVQDRLAASHAAQAAAGDRQEATNNSASSCSKCLFTTWQHAEIQGQPCQHQHNTTTDACMSHTCPTQRHQR
jgi:hypothetical protein